MRRSAIHRESLCQGTTIFRSRSLLAVVLLLASAVGATLPAADDKGEESRPNVVLILADDMGYGDLRLHGNEKIDTPALDRLASQSAQFERFFVCPLCSPSRASLLTGRDHLRTGVASVTRGLEILRGDEVTLAEVLKAAGYTTGCFGKWHLGEHYPHHPNGQGFDEFLGMPTGHWNDYFDPELDHDGELVPTRGFVSDVLTEAAIGFIEKHREQPFFCYLPFNAPHTPLQIPDRYLEKYKARQLDDRTAAIYGLVENIDENVGRLLARLDALGLSRNTIVIFMSDNGAEGPAGSRYNAGMRGMKGTVHEGGMRVPMFVRWPGKIQPNTVIRQIGAGIDLLPTIADLCGVKNPTTKPLDGISLAPLLLNQPDNWPDRMIFTRMPGWKRLVAYREPVVRDQDPFPGSVRTQRWRLVNEGPGWQLYDMLSAPDEATDVAASHPDVVRRLSQAYQQWFADVSRVPPRRPPVPVGYRERAEVELPSSEAFFTGGIRWFNQWGFAHDWLTGWNNQDDVIWWDIEVAAAGRFEVTLVHTCPAEAVGTKLRIEVGGSVLEGSLATAYDPQPQSIPGHQGRFMQTFAELRLGEIQLDQAATRITVKAITKPAETVCDLKSVRLRRVD